MLIKKPQDFRSSEIADQDVFLSRRRFLCGIAATAAVGAVSNVMAPDAHAGRKLTDIRKGSYATVEKLTPYEYATTYNNFYEFGTDKSDPAQHARDFQTRPWTVAVEGAVRKPAVYNYEDLIKPHTLEERIYRLRCVEAWSMVVPWIGIPLADLIKRFEPTSRAKYVEFTTLHDPKRMPGQRPGLFGSGLDWPYVEGLRIDEAMNPLSIFAVGMYGEELPNQNGAPIRLVVPWKYGFKSIKSIVKIRFLEQPPHTAWNKANPREYGFFSNVNPEVDHPRWSQAYERRISEDSWYSPKRKTLMFNGYAEQVAHLYAGMDLKKLF